MADYVSVAEIKADMPDSDIESMSDYDTVLSEMITAASRLIDKEVGGGKDYFDVPTTDTIRYFDGSGEEEQYVDPMISLTSVSVSESGGRASSNYTDWTEDTDYYVWPYNYSALNKPIEKLIVDNFAGSKGKFYSVKKGIKVTGRFGYSDNPPDDIVQAVKITVMRWFMRSKQAYQDTSASAELGQLMYTKSLDPDVIEILKQYKLNKVFL